MRLFGVKGEHTGFFIGRNSAGDHPVPKGSVGEVFAVYYPLVKKFGILIINTKLRIFSRVEYP